MIEWSQYCAKGLHPLYGGFGSRELGYLCKVCNKSGGDVQQVEYALMSLPFYPSEGHRPFDGEESQDIHFLKKVNIVRDVAETYSGGHSAPNFVLALLPVYAAVGVIGKNSVLGVISFICSILIACALWLFADWKKRSIAKLVFALEAIKAEYESKPIRGSEV